jgi:chromosome segregation ATPase
MARTDVTGVYATCPLIDKVIDYIKLYATFEDERDEKEILKLLEEIRHANGTLRDFGTNLYSEKESEINDLEKQISKLEGNISDLEYALKEATLDGETLTKALEQYV